ncbi:beta-lactamase family protein [Irregularibacter muris]|uniref:Beta-lactamase family protein n=1 Tax=Irregularibacter muris TaxID=1796619 RepID=A0AAE3HIR9_9FIRM|nr:serine hydrolase domain-containing protein [Irregularibacter muris]MCR1900095.1 beta-lactamase family protein [Irregularibacter muris]
MKKRGLMRWISLQLVVLILVMMAAGGVSQAAEQGVTPSGIHVSDLETEIETYIEEYKDTTAAVSVAVFQNGETIHEGYYGNGNMEMELKNSTETVMEWGSVTKMLVWVSVMQLVELGEMNLSEDIRTYLPEGFLSNLKYDQPITMMNLMHHNAGWEEQLIDLFIPIGEEVGELGDVLKSSLPNQLYEPGTVVAYSNWGVSLAGYIVERVSGMGFSDYVHKHIFEPLGMEHTALLPTLEDNSWVNEQRDLLKCYSADLRDLGPSRYQLALYPAGMATGTLEDFLLFGKALVPKGRDRSELFRKRETLDQFLSPTLFYHDEKNTPRNAHGLWVDKTEVLALGHGGNTPGASANLQFDPISGIGLVVMTNQSGETVYNIGLQEMIFGKYPEPTDEFQMRNISGVYTQARTIKTGALRLYSFLLTMPFLSGNENNFYVPMMGMELIPVGFDRFLLDYGETVGTGFVSENKNGSPTLEIGVQDYLPKNPIVYAIEIFLILILGLALIYSLYTIIRALVRKLRKKPSEPKNGERILASGGNLGLFFSFLYVVMNVINYETSRNIRLGLILCTIFSAWILIYLVRSIIAFKEWGKHLSSRKIFNTILSCIAMLLNSFYWQWFKFW